MSKGVDIVIDAALSDFNNRLWVSNNRSFYGRVFRNETYSETGTKIIPEISVDGKSYTEVLKDNSLDAQCFFDVLPSREMIKTMEKNTVRVMFMVNLTALYPALTRTEATETVERDVFNILSSNFDDVSILVSGRTAFSDYKFDGKDIADMSPHYLFRFDCISYNVNC